MATEPKHVLLNFGFVSFDVVQGSGVIQPMFYCNSTFDLEVCVSGGHVTKHSQRVQCDIYMC